MNNGDKESGDIVVSVVITAHNRKDHIVSAVKSVLNQTNIKKRTFEILVIKDFPDEQIDAFLSENEITNIRREGTLGEMLHEGIVNCRGQMIMFLDDDDLFFKHKLNHIVSLFTKHPEVMLISNRYKSLDKGNSQSEQDNNSEPCEIYRPSSLTAKEVVKLINDRIDFNLSSISIRKELLEGNLEKLRELKGGPDTFFFLLSLDKRSDFMRTNRQLTSYRVREVSGSKETFIKNDLAFMQERATYMCNMLRPFTKSGSEVCSNVAKYLFEDWKVTEQLLNQYSSRKNFMRLLAYRPRSAKVTFSPYYVLKSLLIFVYLLSPRLGLSFYRVLKNNQSRSILN